MNILHALPLFIACTLAIPCNAQNLHKEFYSFPEAMEKQLKITNGNDKTTSFIFQVKPIIGNASNVKMSAKVVGNSSIVPIPQSTEYDLVDEGTTVELKFILPISKEQAKDKSLKIQGTVEYLPDYSAILKYVEKDSQKEFENEYGKSKLIDNIKAANEQQLTSTSAVRFDPEDINKN